MPKSLEHMTINVITQNILLDKTRTVQGLIAAQDDRVESIAANLNNFSGSLDVVAVQEAYKSDAQHNGEILAALCGNWPGAWVQHNQKPYPESPTGRSNEYVGMFGELIDKDSTWPIELGDNRRAIVTNIADVAFVALHLRAGLIKARPLRRQQAEMVVEALEEFDNAVVLGDFNEPPIRWIAEARDTLRSHGFQSVFPLTKQSHPATFPTPPYGRIYESRARWSLDDILVRGPRVTALAAGVLPRVIEGVADHDGVWATIEISP